MFVVLPILITVTYFISFLFSAGIGRTGTFIALDYTLEEGATEQTVDVKGYVISLRHQRGKSIQTRVKFDKLMATYSKFLLFFFTYNYYHKNLFCLTIFTFMCKLCRYFVLIHEMICLVLSVLGAVHFPS